MSNELINLSNKSESNIMKLIQNTEAELEATKAELEAAKAAKATKATKNTIKAKTSIPYKPIKAKTSEIKTLNTSFSTLPPESYISSVTSIHSSLALSPNSSKNLIELIQSIKNEVDKLITKLSGIN